LSSIIKEGFPKENEYGFDVSFFQKAMENTEYKATKSYLPFFKKNELTKLEDRIRKLEEESDQLICIIHFLIQRISELANRFPNSDDRPEEIVKCKMYESLLREDPRNPESSRANAKPSLTKRETDVFNLLAQGFCAKEIAKTLFISETTVITHKKNLKEKFHAKNTVELISNVLTGSGH
jgi:DNA-binding CsgD family transcriptional regulator